MKGIALTDIVGNSSKPLLTVSPRFETHLGDDTRRDIKLVKNLLYIYAHFPREQWHLTMFPSIGIRTVRTVLRRYCVGFQLIETVLSRYVRWYCSITLYTALCTWKNSIKFHSYMEEASMSGLCSTTLCLKFEVVVLLTVMYITMMSPTVV